MTVFLPYSEAMPFVAVSVVAVLAVRGQQMSLGRILGGISYPFYLNHWIGLFLIHPAINKFGLSLSSSTFLAFVVALAYGTAHYFLVDGLIAIKRDLWFTDRKGRILCGVGFALVTTGTLSGMWLG
jgi:peptidoglycan/LPS O-acetylase OafA/YrhL